MSEILTPTRFGNPILRETARRLTPDEIVSEEIQTLIANMYYTVDAKSYGVGLAAPQIGESIALSVLGIKPTPTRPHLEPFKTVLINPEVIKTHGTAKPMWEGCISCGTGDDTLYAQVPRFESITLRWLDETAKTREEKLGGFVAHVAQHETDHLNGVLFVDRVTDPSTYMMADEFRARITVDRT